MHKSKRQKYGEESAEFAFESSNASLYPLNVKRDSSTLSHSMTNINVVQSIVESEINGGYKRRGKQILTNKINDTGFSYSR